MARLVLAHEVTSSVPAPAVGYTTLFVDADDGYVKFKDPNGNIHEYVANTFSVIAGSGLTGGGTIASNVTLSVSANADGSIVVNENDIQVGTLANDEQHGELGGGSLHQLATTSSAGFASPSHVTSILDHESRISSLESSSSDGMTNPFESANQIWNDSGRFLLSVTGSAAINVTGSLTLESRERVSINAPSGVVVSGTLLVSSSVNMLSSSIQSVKTVSFDREYDNGNCGGTTVVNWNRGQKQVMTLTSSVTMSFASSQGVGNYLLRIIQGPTGGPHTILWPSGIVKWPGGNQITLSTGSLDIDIVSFYYNGSAYFSVGSTDFV